ncbi:hypothetical protein AAZX31_18G086100 [Glycine max]|nr:hypothetical protein GLYMA_18G089901v4 [Glycine max]
MKYILTFSPVNYVFLFVKYIVLLYKLRWIVIISSWRDLCQSIRCNHTKHLQLIWLADTSVLSWFLGMQEHTMINFLYFLALVDTLVAKTRSWEKVHNMPYTYDGVPLFAMLDEYAMLMHEREEKKRRMRDQKKYQELQNIDQEFGFGLRPSPEGHLATKRLLVLAQMEVQMVLLGSYLLMLIKMEASPQQKMEKDNNRLVAPLNYVSISKEDAASHVSGTELVPMSP